MTSVKGPDFIALQAPDIEKSAQFYSEIVGLKRAPQSPPDAVLFLTTPIPFAVRKPLGNLPSGENQVGRGIALWFLCENSVELYERLKSKGVVLLDEPAPGPFGMTFRFMDTDGYVITIHDKS
jgi:predicted enzyme related to lactoylglutathione lyase